MEVQQRRGFFEVMVLKIIIAVIFGSIAVFTSVGTAVALLSQSESVEDEPAMSGATSTIDKASADSGAVPDAGDDAMPVEELTLAPGQESETTNREVNFYWAPRDTEKEQDETFPEVRLVASSLEPACGADDLQEHAKIVDIAAVTDIESDKDLYNVKIRLDSSMQVWLEAPVGGDGATIVSPVVRYRAPLEIVASKQPAAGSSDPVWGIQVQVNPKVQPLLHSAILTPVVPGDDTVEYPENSAIVLEKGAYHSSLTDIRVPQARDSEVTEIPGPRYVVHSEDSAVNGLIIDSPCLSYTKENARLSIDKTAFRGMVDRSSPAAIRQTGEQVPSGSVVPDNENLCFIYTVTNRSDALAGEAITDVNIHDSDSRVGIDGYVGTVPRVDPGASIEMHSCVESLDANPDSQLSGF